MRPCIVGGILAVLPMIAMMKKGAAAIAKSAILGIVIRSAMVLVGVMLAMGPGWGLAKMPLATIPWCSMYLIHMIAWIIARGTVAYRVHS